jgi:hypothetical protein
MVAEDSCLLGYNAVLCDESPEVTQENMASIFRAKE